MRNIRSIAAVASILILSFVAFVTCTMSLEETYDPTSNELKLSASCIEGFNACRNFMTNQRCFGRSIWKRTSRVDASGPFWANRGKRDPYLTSSRLYAEEPRWELVRPDEDGSYDPYFTTRGKKLKDNIRDRRTEEKIFYGAASPFLAARGKKDNSDNFTE